jgi:hypothetical protein
MTTMPLVSGGGATPTLPEPATHLDITHPGDALGAGSDALGGAHSGGDALALFGASHDLHPLAQQHQQQVAYFGNDVAQAGATKAATHKVVPDAATRTYDVATTSQADIDALKNSPDPKQQRLGHTIENAKASYGDLLGKDIKIAAALNAGNGGEPVLTITSEKFRYTEPTRVHTHYHGDNATVGDPVGSKAGQNSRIREILARDPQTVFVLPECSNATPTADGPKNDNSYHADWSNVKSQADTTDLALKAAGADKKNVVQETVSVHSRGGEVIQKLMDRDPSGKALRADRLELHDSLYGSQGAVAQWGHTDNGKHVGHVIYVHGSNGGIKGDGRDREIAKAFKGKYIPLDISHQKPLNDQNNPVVYDGKDAKRDDHIHGPKGHEGVRQFNPDVHYQTTGRFLGIWPLPLSNG